MPVGRILSIDYGEKRIGLAVSDPLGITAHALDLLIRTKVSDDFDKIMELIKEYDVTKVVIGLPLNMDGSEGFMVEAVRKFSAGLKNRCPIEIVELDERLTSMEAERALNQASIKGKKKKAKMDGIAAQIILQTYLSMQ
jgi:putative Holliday junction resolvase